MRRRKGNAKAKKQDYFQSQRGSKESVRQLPRKEQLKQNEDLIHNFLVLIEKSDATVKIQMGLGRKPNKIDNTGQARPMRVTFNNDTDVNDIMTNLNGLTNAEESLKQLWIHPDRSFKKKSESSYKEQKTWTNRRTDLKWTSSGSTKMPGSNQRGTLQTEAEIFTDAFVC